MARLSRFATKQGLLCFLLLLILGNHAAGATVTWRTQTSAVDLKQASGPGWFQGLVKAVSSSSPRRLLASQQSVDVATPPIHPSSSAAAGRQLLGQVPAAVSSAEDPTNGFPLSYTDENGAKMQQCTMKGDPYCILLADAWFNNPKAPFSFLDPTDATGDTLAGPINFPGEFFYYLIENAPFEVDSCTPSTPAKVLIRSALEGTFVNGNPAPHEQMVFGRVRVSATGLCPNASYKFIYPYGAIDIQTGSKGNILRASGTSDVGCTPVAPAVCDFTLPLQSPVLDGFMRWDNSDPPPPAGYAGDAVTPHAVTGSPFMYDSNDGQGPQPANFVKVMKLADPMDPASADTVVGETDQFVVMGKYMGPVEAVDVKNIAFLPQPTGAASAAQTVTLQNTGIAPVTINAVGITGEDAGDFSISGQTCQGALAPGDTCTVSVTFIPAATGLRSASLTITHSGLNNPFTLLVGGTGQTGTATPTINYTPRTVVFPKVKLGRVSQMVTITIDNIGGGNPLAISNPHFMGSYKDEFVVRASNCPELPEALAVGASCAVDILFAPFQSGSKTTTFVVDSNAPGGTQGVPITATATNVASASGLVIRAQDGFPTHYQDEVGNRLEPCLTQNDLGCIILPDATYVANKPLAFPSNFPGEFFYFIADSDQVTTPGCPNANIPPGTAFVRLALEGTFINVNGAPVAGDQITFTRIRVKVRGGLCPNVPYTFVTPYGPITFTTDSSGSVTSKLGTIDTGCGAAPCSFADALANPGSANNAHTPIESFLRWDPNAAPAAPAGHLGDGTSLHKVVGGTYVPEDGSTNGAALNEFQIRDSAGNFWGRTDLFLVSGRLAGPLFASTNSLQFPATETNKVSDKLSVKVNNIGEDNSQWVSAYITGPDANQFSLDGTGYTTSGSSGMIGIDVARDSSCSMGVTFKPTSSGSKNAILVITAPNGQVNNVALAGAADPAPAPIVGVSATTLAFPTTTPNAPLTTLITVRNTGNAPLVITSEAITGTAAADFKVDTAVVPPSGPANCGPLGTNGITVAASSACQVAVKFTPSAIGVRTGTLTLKHNDQQAGVSGTTTISLSGTGDGSTFSVQSAGFSKVNINTNKDLTVNIQNTHKTRAVTTAAFVAGTTCNPAVNSCITGAQAGFFSVVNNGAGCLGATLQPGKTCQITVRFRPTTRGTNYAATLSVKGDATSLPAVVTSALTGSGQ